MSIYFLNNDHHNQILSCGPRHMAAVDIGGVLQFTPYDEDFYSKVGKSLIPELIIDYIKSQPKSFFGLKVKPVQFTLGSRKFKFLENKKVTLGNYTFEIAKDGKGFNVYPTKDKSIFNSARDVERDGHFMSWFTQHYDFLGLGELQDEIYSIMLSRYVMISQHCIKWFHTQCSPDVDRKQYNPEVCCRQITFAFWGCQTMINAIKIKSFGELSVLPRKSSEECVRDFSDLANKMNGTNFMHSSLWYNAETTKRAQEAHYQMVRKMYRI